MPDAYSEVSIPAKISRLESSEHCRDGSMHRVAPDFVPPGYLSLRFAVARVGESIFGNQWIANVRFLEQEEVKFRRTFDLARASAVLDDDRVQRDEGPQKPNEFDARTKAEIENAFAQLVHTFREIEYIRCIHGKSYEEIRALSWGERLALSSATPENANEFLAWDSAQTRRMLFGETDPGPRPDYPMPEWPRLRAADYDELRDKFESDNHGEIVAWNRMERAIGHLRNWLYSNQVRACVVQDDGRKLEIPSHFWAKGVIPDLVFQTGQIHYSIEPNGGAFNLTESQPTSRLSRLPSDTPSKVFVSEAESLKFILKCAMSTKFPEQAGSTIAAVGRCQKWLETLMRAGPPGKESKRERFVEAEKQFRVSWRGFQRAWANAVERVGNKEWSRPGRKS